MTELEQAALGALAPIEESLASDGYALTVTEQHGGALQVGIEALEGACADCLVPESVMIPMIERLLVGGGVSASGVTVSYPADSAHH